MKSRKKELIVPTTEEVECLLHSFSNAPTSVRNRALVAVMWRCGLRVSEALALRPGDISDRGVVVVRCGKGGKSRAVGINPGTRAIVEAWVAVRRTLGGLGRTDPLFTTLAGAGVSASYVRSMLIRKSRKLGLPQLHPHALRHAFAVGLSQDGTSVPNIQRQLGHSYSTTTDIYLQGLGEDDAVDAVRLSAWTLGDDADQHEAA